MPSADQFVARLPAPARRDLVEWEKRRPREYATAILARKVPVESLLKHDEAALLADDRPYNEYYLLRRAWNRVDGSDRDIY